MNGKKNQTSEGDETKKNDGGGIGHGPISKGGYARKNGEVEGDARRKIENRTFVDSRGLPIRRREFRKAKREKELTAKKDERKKEIRAAYAALVATAELV